MDYKQIEQLLDRYWQCETSLEEESQLRTFFNGKDIPDHLRRYKHLFAYQQMQKKVGLGADFDMRILAKIEAPVVKARRLTITTRFMPLFKAASIVVLVLSLGNVMQHSFFSDVKEVATADTIGKQISAPSVAFSGDATVSHEQQILDSLHRIDKSSVEMKK